jgi:hypothetical protein
MASFTEYLPKLARFGVGQITIALTEKYVRRKLGLKADEPLKYGSIPLKCIGSERWRKKKFLEEQALKRASQPK